MPSRALVTGGGRGIGAAIARELAGEGWHVTVSARSRDEVESVAQEIGGTAVTGDVTKREDVERMLAAAAPIDLLVANAGVSIWEESWETDVDEWWRVLEVNVLGTYLTCRLALPAMVERGEGRIVITGSGAAYLPGSTSTAYPASKAAVCRFADDLPWTPPELAPRLVAALASGRFDALAGRYLHAEHDPLDELEARIERILADDLNAIRLRREAT